MLPRCSAQGAAQQLQCSAAAWLGPHNAASRRTAQRLHAHAASSLRGASNCGVAARGVRPPAMVALVVAAATTAATTAASKGSFLRWSKR